MFDIEKMMKPVFEKHIPALLVQFEKNKKRDWIMNHIMETNLKSMVDTGVKDNLLSLNVKRLSEAYDLVHEEMKAQGIIK